MELTLSFLGFEDAYIYRVTDRVWFRSHGREYWAFEEESGIRVVENPF